MSNTLTPEQIRTLRALTTQEQAFRKGAGKPLEDHEQAWRMEAMMAVAEERVLKEPYLPENMDDEQPIFMDKEVPGEIKEKAFEDILTKAEKNIPGVPPAEEFHRGQMDEAVKDDLSEAEEPEMTDEEIAEEVRGAMSTALKEEGLWEEYETAKEKWGDVWVNSSNGVIFGFRKLRFKDILEAGDLENLLDEMKMVTERCVVLNKDALVGDDPSAYVYEMVYQLVRAVSDSRPDMAYSVKV